MGRDAPRARPGLRLQAFELQAVTCALDFLQVFYVNFAVYQKNLCNFAAHSFLHADNVVHGLAVTVLWTFDENRLKHKACRLGIVDSFNFQRFGRTTSCERVC